MELQLKNDAVTLKNFGAQDKISSDWHRKVGIMGGTFNPIHNGHLLLAQEAYHQLGLEQVLFIPSGNSYMKKNVLDTQKRVEMVRLAIENYPYFALSLIEAEKPGNTYTCETLETLTALNTDIQYYFIIGADTLFQIEQWWHPERIYQLAVLVCAIRNQYELADIKKRGTILAQLGAKIIYLDMPKIELSSTDIRERVRNNLSITEYVPIEVANYIKQEHLYHEKD